MCVTASPHRSLRHLFNVSFYSSLNCFIFHWSLSDIKSPQISKTLISILAYLTMIESGSSWFFHWFSVPLIIVSNSWWSFAGHQVQMVSLSHAYSITIFSSQIRFKYIFSLYFIFNLGSAETEKSTWWQIIIFLLVNAKSSRWDFFISLSQSPRKFFWSCLRGNKSALCIYYLVEYYYFAKFSVNPLSHPIMLLISSFSIRLMTRLIWLIISSLSAHNQYACYSTNLSNLLW